MQCMYSHYICIITRQALWPDDNWGREHIDGDVPCDMTQTETHTPEPEDDAEPIDSPVDEVSGQ